MPASQIKLTKALQQLKTKKLLLLSLNTPGYHQAHPFILKYLTEKSKGIYISFNKQYFEIQSIIEKTGIDKDKVYCIDAISKKDKNLPKGCYCLNSPESLTELSIVLTNLLKEGYEFIFFDSLSSLLIYNDLETVERFVHYLTGKMKYLQVKGVFIILNDTKSRDLIQVISPFFDAHIDLTK
ncbi:MAG: hypothetical protein Q7S55_03030 [Nanoarchaeota archaeon]|nr:hypothetical protein [Nanoarchaeota archaeon]